MASITLMVADKQRGPRSEKTGKYGPWKIADGGGAVYKAWDDIAGVLAIGATYDCRVETVQARGDYPPDTFIKHAVEAKERMTEMSAGIHPPRNGPEHGMIVKESFQQLAAGKTPAQILDWWIVAEEIYDRLKSGASASEAAEGLDNTF